MNENIWVLYVLILSTIQLESCFRECVPVRLRAGRKRNCTVLWLKELYIIIFHHHLEKSGLIHHNTEYETIHT